MQILKTIFKDICAGYSSFQYLDSEVFIKHLTQEDSYLIDLEHDKYFERAARRNIPTRSEKLVQLQESGDWTQKDERSLKEHEDYIKNLNVTYKKMVIESQKKNITKQIEEGEKKKNQILYKKLSLMGITCEKYAEDKTNQYYIYYSIFKDKDLTNRYFTDQEFDELDDGELGKLINLYSETLSTITTLNVKKLSVSDFFTSRFYLCGDNLHLFFNKPILSLTFNQINLLNYGNYYKRLLQNNDIPAELLDEPDQIEDFVQTSRNAKESLDKNQNQNVGVVGGKRDMENFGAKSAINPIMEKLKKDGRIKGAEAAIKVTS